MENYKFELINPVINYSEKHFHVWAKAKYFKSLYFN